MIRISVICLVIIFISTASLSGQSDGQIPVAGSTKKLPLIFPENHPDILSARLKLEASCDAGLKRLPDNFKDWEIYKNGLKKKIIEVSGAFVDHKLPLNIKETGSVQKTGYTVKKIYFQTIPGIYATANLYVPDGTGPFPGVINMCGHWDKAKIDTTGIQAVGHSLAMNGYVCLTIDPWGSGERTTIHGIFEDHGDENNLGSALLDIGKPMIGLEISDNMRGVDLLCSLPYVDSSRLGATGASGGGTQTLWLSALDERIKAVMMVVSAGTFESHIMGSPCICEVMNGALTFTEEAGALALIAPRALKMCNHKKDEIPAFNPSEMIRSFNNAKPVFKMYGVENNIDYQLFDLHHGYWKEDREALLGWFDLHLKNKVNGNSSKEIPFKQIREEELMVFPNGNRDPGVITTSGYCIEQGNILRKALINSGSISAGAKREDLRKILGQGQKTDLRDIHEFVQVDKWNRFALETTDNKLIPLLISATSADYREIVIISNPEGKNKIPLNVINEYLRSGIGVAMIDFSGTGEASSVSVMNGYNAGQLRIVARSELWFGKTISGEWVNELGVVSRFISEKYKAAKIILDGDKETGLAGLFYAATGGAADSIILREAPVSYLFDSRNGVDFFSSGVHIPGILNWGDISLVSALTGTNVRFIKPVTMSGNPVTGEKLMAAEEEFEKIRVSTGQSGTVVFR